MKMTNVNEEEAKLNFIKEAAIWFEKNPEHQTYGIIESGKMFASRWGVSQDCILVFKISEDVEPTIYSQVIKGEVLTAYIKSYGQPNKYARPREVGDI